MQVELDGQVQKMLEAMQLLDRFVGNWTTSGLTSDNEPLVAFDSYIWLQGGYFLIHQWNANLAEQNISGIEIIGFDSKNETYFTQAYDSIGNIAKYNADLKKNAWKIWGDAERYNGEFNSGNTILNGCWEIMQNGVWKHWMSIELHKIK
jgi:hypothetical protein